MGRYFVKVLSLVMVFVMLVGLAACGPGSAPASNTNTNNQTPAQQGNEASGQSNAASNQGENTPAQTGNEASNQPGGEPSNQVEEKPDNSVTVTNVEELLDAIKPDANIILAKGTYNLSETLKKIKESGYREWQQSHPYTWIQDRYDGPELIIQSANGLVLKGQTEDFSDTQLVTDPRYANVLYIQDCTNVTISNMTLGHTIAAECKGSVIFLENTKNTILDNVDLYGCGVYGIEFDGPSANLKAINSTIRDCSYGAININEGADGGVIEFTDCTLTGNGSGGNIPLNLFCEVYFNHCIFGERESGQFAFDYAVIASEDCYFEDITSYPEYGPTTPVFIPSLFEKEDLNPYELVNAGMMMAYVMLPPDTDPNTITWRPFVAPDGRALRLGMGFNEDGTGYILPGSGDLYKLTWKANDDKTVSYEAENGKSGTIECYSYEIQDYPGSFQEWIKVSYSGYDTWFVLSMPDIEW